jgi:hypothetical protein
MTEIEDEDEADPFAQLEDGMLSEISPDELVDPGLTDPLAEAESLVAVGMNEEALALLTGDHRLEARVIVARALRAKGRRKLDARLPRQHHIGEQQVDGEREPHEQRRREQVRAPGPGRRLRVAPLLQLLRRAPQPR